MSKEGERARECEQIAKEPDFALNWSMQMRMLAKDFGKRKSSNVGIISVSDNEESLAL